MVRAFGITLPAAALAGGIAALALWVSAISRLWLDTLVSILFAAGLLLALAGYLRGKDPRTRRLSIIALGWNAVGLGALLILYAVG